MLRIHFREILILVLAICSICLAINERYLTECAFVNDTSYYDLPAVAKAAPLATHVSLALLARQHSGPWDENTTCTVMEATEQGASFITTDAVNTLNSAVIGGEPRHTDVYSAMAAWEGDDIFSNLFQNIWQILGRWFSEWVQVFGHSLILYTLFACLAFDGMRSMVVYPFRTRRIANKRVVGLSVALHTTAFMIYAFC